MRKTLIIAVVALVCACAAPPSGEPIAQGSERKSKIGYASVAAALHSVQMQQGMKIGRQDGWIIASDNKEHVIWSFTPDAHPAHPSAVKRRVFEKNGEVYIDMQVLCEANAASCDRLIDQFDELNDRMREQLRSGA
ncbi:MAG: molecular chaperone DnaJ [Gammaproteobacteria bacterium]